MHVYDSLPITVLFFLSLSLFIFIFLFILLILILVFVLVFVIGILSLLDFLRLRGACLRTATVADLR